jgi:hypothetical protein
MSASVDAPAWTVEGLSPSGIVREGLRLVRLADNAKKDASVTAKPQELPTWVTVRRVIEIRDQVTVNSAANRIGAVTSGAQVRVPLLAGERITSSSGSLEDGSLLLTFPPQGASLGYTSVLPFGPDITLENKPAPRVSEEWLVSCHETIACSFEGPAPTASVVDGRRTFLWHTFPGEKVVLHTKRLEGTSGDFVTVDSAAHVWDVLHYKGTVDVSLRATQQTTFSISVPGAAQVSSALIDQKNEGQIEKGGRVSFLLNPGEHALSVSYQLPIASPMIETVPSVSTSAPAHNVTVRVSPSPERWLIWTSGPAWGPCVVYWSKLIIIVALCAMLARLGMLPCSALSGALLGVGLTSLPMMAISFPLLWLYLLLRWSEAPVKPGKLARSLRLTAVCLLTLLSLALLYGAVEIGLVLQPPMLIAGNNSTWASLNWFIDHTSKSFPEPTVYSFPLWYWRAFSLAWATWLVVALLRWLSLTVAVIRKTSASAAETEASAPA